MCILAHPDDESLGTGGTLAKYADEGVETHIICATRGERGRFGDAEERPPIEVVAETREKELLAAAKILGVKAVHFLDYVDKDLDKADPAEVIGKIVPVIRRVRPQVVITFDPFGGYGHPDHIAISQFAGASIVSAADPDYHVNGSKDPVHRVSKMYFMTWSPIQWDAYQAAFKVLKSHVDGHDRYASPWAEWAITTSVDTGQYWETVWKAVQCHKTQLTIYGKLAELPEEKHEAIWGSQQYYRVFSTVNGGRTLETDLFEGIR